MKFNCGKSPEEKREIKRAKQQAKRQALYDEFARDRFWHDWYAWYPVRVGKRDCRWLEVVERRDTITDKARWDPWERVDLLMQGRFYNSTLPKYTYRAKVNKE